MGTILELIKDLPLTAVQRVKIQELEKENESLKIEASHKDQKIATQERLIQELQETSKVVCDLPKCPNCSIPSKPVYMRPMSRDEKAVTGQNHECPKCHFSL